MKLSNRMRELLIEVLSEKYEYNRQRLSMDCVKIYYDEEDLDRMRKENEYIKKILDELRNENK